VFTRNRVVASPVKLTRKAVADGRLVAGGFNFGNANARHGGRGEPGRYKVCMISRMCIR